MPFLLSVSRRPIVTRMCGKLCCYINILGLERAILARNVDGAAGSAVVIRAHEPRLDLEGVSERAWRSFAKDGAFTPGSERSFSLNLEMSAALPQLDLLRRSASGEIVFSRRSSARLSRPCKDKGKNNKRGEHN